MKHVFDTLDGADDFPDFTVSTTAMRWRPGVMPERTWSPGDLPLLPPAPESAYLADAVHLDIRVNASALPTAVREFGEQLTWFFDELKQDRRRVRLSAMRRAYRAKRGRRW